MDEADMSDQRIEESISDGINEASRAVAKMPEGEPGECSGWASTSLGQLRDIADSAGIGLLGTLNE
jgi:hypothetical protein